MHATHRITGSANPSESVERGLIENACAMPSSGNPPKIHHYIPAFYTRRWAGDDHLLCQFSRPHKLVIDRRVSPKGTGYLERGYELRGFPAQLAQQVELNFFRPVDNAAADALARMEDGNSNPNWTVQERSSWTQFLLSLLLRCPEDIEQLRSIWAHDYKSVTSRELEARYQAVRAETDPPTFGDYMASTPQDVYEQSFFGMVLSLITNKNVGQFIVNMEWRVLKLPQSGYEFLTSDRPVIRTNGLKYPGGHLALPIGPRAIFLATNDSRGARDILNMDPREIVKNVNQQVVEGAARFVYATGTQQMRFVKNHFGLDRQPRLTDAMQRRKSKTSGLARATA